MAAAGNLCRKGAICPILPRRCGRASPLSACCCGRLLRAVPALSRSVRLAFVTGSAHRTRLGRGIRICRKAFGKFLDGLLPKCFRAHQRALPARQVKILDPNLCHGLAAGLTRQVRSRNGAGFAASCAAAARRPDRRPRSMPSLWPGFVACDRPTDGFVVMLDSRVERTFVIITHLFDGRIHGIGPKAAVRLFHGGVSGSDALKIYFVRPAVHFRWIKNWTIVSFSDGSCRRQRTVATIRPAVRQATR